MIFSPNIELVTDDMRATAMEAHDEIVRLREENKRQHVEILRLRLAMSVSYPVIKQHSPALARLLFATLENPTISGPVLVFDRTKEEAP